MKEGKRYIYKNAKGHLVLIGGAEDKNGEKTVLKSITDINDPKTAVIIPTASSYPSGLADDYRYAFRGLGVENIEIFDIRDKTEADKEEYLKNVESADLIFFTGGDQVKLVDIIGGTKLFELIYAKYLNGCTIAGTSAGAAAASDHMIYDGDDHGLVKGTVRTKKGFGFLKNITIDTHFIARDRLLRLSQLLNTGINTKGIGLGEDTAIIIEPSGIFRVTGSGVITIVDAAKISYSNYENIDIDNLLNINGLNIGFLQKGSVFDLENWKVICSSSEGSNDAMQEILRHRLNR